MHISEVRIKLIPNPADRLKAFASVTLDGDFVVRDIKVIDGSSGVFVAMPSRKLSDRCDSCGYKNHMRAKFCNECGSELPQDRVPKDRLGRNKLHADIAHPINSECRQMLQQRIVESYNQEIEQAREPGYQPLSDDEYDGMDEEFAAEPVEKVTSNRKAVQVEDVEDDDDDEVDEDEVDEEDDEDEIDEDEDEDEDDDDDDAREDDDSGYDSLIADLRKDAATRRGGSGRSEPRPGRSPAKDTRRPSEPRREKPAAARQERPAKPRQEPPAKPRQEPPAKPRQERPVEARQKPPEPRRERPVEPRRELPAETAVASKTGDTRPAPARPEPKPVKPAVDVARDVGTSNDDFGEGLV